MATDTRTVPVGDSVAKVDNELAVGEDLEFQRRWWRFERWIWRFFALLILADLLGVFGRGPLANAHIHTPDGAVSVDYERIERFSTPSNFVVRFGPAAVHDGIVRLWVGDSIIMRLGNQRISPQPARSTFTAGGVLYTFPATGSSGTIAFSLQPAYSGISHIALRLLTSDAPNALNTPQDEVRTTVFVMP